MKGTLRSDGSRWTGETLLSEADDVIRQRLMRAGRAPSMDALAGWEFDGVNTAWFAAPFRKFQKAFFEGPARGPDRVKGPSIQGFNLAVSQDGVDAPHRPRGSSDRPFRHGFFRVYLAGAAPETGVPRYPNALVLDYGMGANGPVDPQGLLRDYLVQLYEDDPDLLLGHAYGALPVVDRLFSRQVPKGRVSLGFFVLRRARPHDFHGVPSPERATPSNRRGA